MATDDSARSDAVPDRALLDQLITRYPFGAIVVFDLVITDAVMPQMSGIRLAREVRAAASDTPIVIMTGYTEEELDEMDWGHVEYLEKPFKLDRLRGLVQRLLSDAGD